MELLQRKDVNVGMERRQGTLDQVFRARKRKLTSPSASSSKLKRHNYVRAAEEVVEISPLRKGNLEAFLFTAKREDPPSSSTDGLSGAILEAWLPELRPDEVKFSSSKPWLTPCSLPSRPTSAEAVKDQSKSEGVGPIERKDSDRISTQSPTKTQIIQPLPSPSITQQIHPETQRLSENEGGREFSRPAVEGAKNISETSMEKKQNGATTSSLSQFANDFLSLCYSGITSSIVTKPPAAELLTLQQKRKDDLALAEFAGRKKPCPELIPAHKGLQDEYVSPSTGEQHSVNRVKDRRRSLDTTINANDAQVEKQVRVCVSSEDFIEDVSLKGESSIKRCFQNKSHLEQAQLHSSPEGLPVSLIRNRARNLLSSSPNCPAGSPSEVACIARNCRSPTNSRIPVSKFEPCSDELGIKVGCTPPEIVLAQGKTALECRDKRVNGNFPGSRSFDSNPLKKAFSKSPPGHEGEETLLTPESGTEQKPASTSAHGINAGGSNYRSSLFSPGDEFWEEAIEIVMASKVDILHQSGLEKPNRRSSPNKRSTSDVQRLKSIKGDPKYEGLASHGSVPIKKVLSPQTSQLQAATCIVPEALSTFDKKTPFVPKLKSVPAVDGQEQVKTVRSQSKLSNYSQITNRDGPGSGSWFKHFGTSPVSPLPVRHFDFSGKGEDMYHRIHQDPCQEKSNNIHSMVKQTVKEEDGMKKQNMEETASAGPDAAQAEHNRLNPSLVASSVAAKPRAESIGTGLAPPNALLATHSRVHTSKTIVTKGRGTTSAEVVSRGPHTTTSDLSSSSTVQQRTLEISDWLPQEVAAVYARKGLKHLYPWQLECLQLKGVLDGRNLVYGASTSAGKSLVAELLMIRRVVSTGRMALLVLPFVSICSEKAEHLEGVLEPLGKRVRNFFGTQGSATVPKDTSVAVCTIEKANSLVNKLLEENRLSEVGLIVIDELHMVGDRDRGYLLELLLTKIRYSCGEFDKIRGLSQEKALANAMSQSSAKSESKADLQVIGMSATMPNIDAVAHWLQAALYETDFRPVPLEEFFKVGNAIYNRKMEIARIIRKEADLGGKDPDHVVELCYEVVKEGHSVLVFCASRKACETTAMHIAKYLPSRLSSQRHGTTGLKDGASAVSELKKSSSGLDSVLEQTLPFGVAYHHAGLTVEEREVVERCFKQGVVNVLTATSTLAAGVNLPARRVIFRQPKIGRDFLDGTRYRQMAGRAGRAGIDTKGESVLICKPEEVKRMVTVVSEGCQPLQSCLTDDKIGMMRALLEVVAGGIVQTPQDVNRYVRCTLFNSTQSFDQVVKSVQDSLRWLCRKKFVEWNTETQVYITTPLGRAAFGSSLSPEESLVVFEDLAKAREGFVLASDLHLVYQVTPIYVDLEPDWPLFYQKFVELSPLDQAVGSRVGVIEPFLMRMAHGAPMGSGSRSKGIRSPTKRNVPSPLVHGIVEGKFTGRHQTMDALRVSRRFYVALMLSKLVQEVPLMEVSVSFKVPRGTVQGLQASAGRFAAMVAGFCERLGWHDLEGLVSKFQSRVSFGVRSEIVELTEIPFIKGARARALYKSGFRTVQAVAEATFPELVKALSEASPWVVHEDDSRRKNQQRALMGVVRKIKVGAQRIVLDRAEEARIAAFSAIRAMGVDVPSALWPPIQNNVVLASAIIGEVALNGSPEPVAISDMPLEDQLRSGVNIHHKGSLQDVDSTTEVKRIASTRTGDVVLVGTNLNKTGHEGDRPDQSDKENQVKVTKVESKSHDTRGEPPVNKDSVIQKYKKVAGSALNLNCLFGGTDFLKGRSLEKDVSDGVDTVEILNSGPIDVDKMTGGFETFHHQWRSVDEFYFDLNYKNQTTETSNQVFDIEGIAICWQDSPVYYISLSKTTTCGSEKGGGNGSLLDKKNSLMDNTVHRQQVVPASGNAPDLLDIIEGRWKKISSVLSRHGSTKVSWNLKNQLRALHHAGVSHIIGKPDDVKNAADHILKQKNTQSLSPTFLGEPYLDVHIAAWLLWPDEESSHTLTLEQEVKKRLPGEVAANVSRAGRWTNQMGGVSHNGCCRRVAQIRALHSSLWKRLTSEGLHYPLLGIEMPMVKVLAEMESSALGVDMDACCRVRQVIEQRLKGLEARAHQLAGTPFALSVHADVANTLYKHLKLPVAPGCKKGKQHPSTNKHALDFLKNYVADLKRRWMKRFEYSEFPITLQKKPICHQEFLIRHQHPIAGVIQEHRKLSKLLHSTLASILVWAKTPTAFNVKERLKHVHHIFGHWLQTSTATGRLSMEEPNLQCVEKTISFSRGDGFNQDAGEPNNDMVEINTRQLFVPTQDRWILLSADYSQIEVRLMAHFSDDAALIALLSRKSGDLFRMISSQWTGVSEDSVTDKQRDQTKKLVYGILYGMGVHAVAEQLDCSIAESSLYLERFKSSFPGVHSWLQQACINCQKSGYITTLGGRKRFLEKINNGTHAEQAKAERQAVNSICQGSAADLIKMAMIKLHAAIAGDVGTGSQAVLRGHCRLLLQIHDELVLEVDKVFLQEVSDTLQSCMEGAATLKVPLQINLRAGPTWGSLNPLDDSLMKALLS